MSTTSTQFERITHVFERRAAHITLSNPTLNVIDIAMMDELSAVLTEIASKPQISTILLRGAGQCFSAGVDIAAHAPDKVGEMLRKFHTVVRALIATNKVTVAVVRGACLGGGAELALVCDLVYTADEAQWGFPEIQLGCFPPVAATALSGLIGQKRAADLVLTGRTISGSEAAAIGLANRAAPEKDLETAVEETIQRLQKLSPAALAITKRAIYAWHAMHFDKGLARAEQIYLDELMKTEDAQEGIRAFLEKRDPQWKSR
jgi:cyclohexa-1,5-dienecarbonyl-CoA hydratase